MSRGRRLTETERLSIAEERSQGVAAGDLCDVPGHGLRALERVEGQLGLVAGGDGQEFRQPGITAAPGLQQADEPHPKIEILFFISNSLNVIITATPFATNAFIISIKVNLPLSILKTLNI